MLKDVAKDTTLKDQLIVSDVKDTVPNVEMPNIVLNVSSQEPYGIETVLDHAQEVTITETVIVSEDHQLSTNITEESSKTLTETCSSELNSGPSMIITSDMPWEKDTSMPSEDVVMETIG